MSYDRVHKQWFEELGITDECENDCTQICPHCDKSFHELKNEDELSHDEELNTWNGFNHCYECRR